MTMVKLRVKATECDCETSGHDEEPYHWENETDDSRDFDSKHNKQGGVMRRKCKNATSLCQKGRILNVM